MHYSVLYTFEFILLVYKIRTVYVSPCLPLVVSAVLCKRGLNSISW